MKKRVLFIGLILLVIIPFIPIRTKMKDGSTIYKSMVYKITKVHRPNDKTHSYDDGTIIEILGTEVHNSVPVPVYVKVLEKEDVMGENGLLFTIHYIKSENVPVQLDVYDDNKYILHTNYKACREGELCNLMLQYTKSTEGTYDYDVLKILQESRDGDEYNGYGDYEIYLGKDEHRYITYDSNNYLQYFLKQINVDLKEKAIPDYE